MSRHEYCSQTIMMMTMIILMMMIMMMILMIMIVRDIFSVFMISFNHRHNVVHLGSMQHSIVDLFV